jgi:hypothetical protein
MKLKKIMSLRQELEQAIHSHSEAKIKKIMNEGIDLNFTFRRLGWHSNCTPLQLLLREKFSTCFIQEFIEAGADVNFLNDSGEHSLFYVQTTEQIDLLRSLNVDLELKNEQGISTVSSNINPKLKSHILSYIKIIQEKNKFNDLIPEIKEKPEEKSKRKI